MTLTQLEYALAIERNRSFSKAARELHVSQPTLSAQVQKLEEELEVLLFDRSRNPVEVTASGAEVLRQARIVLDESRRLREVARGTQGAVRGVFRLGVIPTIAPNLLPIFLDRFTKAYPEVSLVIEEDKTTNLMHRLDRGELDGAILSTPNEAPASLMERTLYYEPFVVFAGRQSPLREHKKVTMTDLPMAHAVLLDETHCMRDQVEQICRAKKAKVEGLAPVRFEGGSLQTLVSVVEGGPSYTFLPWLAAESLPNRVHDAHVRPIEKPVPVRKISLVYHRAHLNRAILDALSSTILATLPAELARDRKAGFRVLDPEEAKFETLTK